MNNFRQVSILSQGEGDKTEVVAIYQREAEAISHAALLTREGEWEETEVDEDQQDPKAAKLFMRRVRWEQNKPHRHVMVETWLVDGPYGRGDEDDPRILPSEIVPTKKKGKLRLTPLGDFVCKHTVCLPRSVWADAIRAARVLNEQGGDWDIVFCEMRNGAEEMLKDDGFFRICYKENWPEEFQGNE
jgi:hypothetical protein